MVTILPPSGSITFIVAVLGPLILGFLVGIIIKSALKIGIAILIIVILLIIGGVISPDQVIGPIVSTFRSGQAALTKAREIAGYLPYSSVTFIIGAIIGFLKG